MPDTDNTDIPRAVQNGMSQAEYDAWMFVSKLPDRRADAKEPYTYIVSIKELIDLIAQEANKARLDTISDMIIECYNHDNPIDIANELIEERRRLEAQLQKGQA